jgi:hypothetical protein
LSEKYLAYKDLADRCMIQITKKGKLQHHSHLLDDQLGDKRAFYLTPSSPFLQNPRDQNQFRNNFVREITEAPHPEPVTLFADDLHKVSKQIRSY